MRTLHGRFRKPLDREALEFSTSLPVDRRLYREDIEGSLAHVAMLSRKKIIPLRKAERIKAGLRSILREIERGSITLTVAEGGKKRWHAEDIHMAIEHHLTRKIGDVAGLLHTARSRNDQVALDERLYLGKETGAIVAELRRLQKTLLQQAGRNRSTVMPGYTHLQRAQPILLAHHLLAYVSMLDRDADRFTGCLRRVMLSPLGAGALAGTSFPVDRKGVARSLGFRGVVENSIDAVSDRDALLEFLSACAIAMMHLSRFAEEVVLWSSQEWRFVRIGEEFTTGSSIMPQKVNPDIAELVRGKTGRVYGDLVALLTVMKGLPLAYNRDMQEDKEPLFDAADTVKRSVRLTWRMLRSVKFDRQRFEGELAGDFLMATEIADYLTRKGMPFRNAHALAGDIVRECMEKGVTLAELPLKEYRKRSPLFANDLFTVLSPRSSLAGKRSAGSTSPAEVEKALKSWKRRLSM
jgi:argininosuccinate lyase